MSRICVKKYLFFATLLCALQTSNVVAAPAYERARTLFALGKWQEVLDLNLVSDDVSVDLMRLESNLRLSRYNQALAISSQLLPRLSSETKKVALLKLMDAAQKNDDVARFFEFDQSYIGLEPDAPVKIRYWRGRMHFMGHRFDRAIADLLTIPLSSEYGIRAQYLLASAELLAGKPQFALNRFTKLQDVQAVVEDDQKIIDIAARSRARMLYRMGRYDDAVAAFQYLSPSEMDPFEYSWALLRLGDQISTNQVRFNSQSVRGVLAAGEYEGAAKILKSLPSFLPGSDQDFKKRILWAELLQRQEKEAIAIPIFENVIFDTEQLVDNGASLQSAWLMKQPEIVEVNSNILKIQGESEKVLALLHRFDLAKQSERPDLVAVADKESSRLNKALAQLEVLKKDLELGKTEIIATLRPRWQGYLNQFGDSARAGLFTTRLRANAHLDDAIHILEQTKASDLQRLEMEFENAESGAR